MKSFYVITAYSLLLSASILNTGVICLFYFNILINSIIETDLPVCWSGFGKIWSHIKI